jgi:YVTN family beta-propeller protein
MKKSLISIGLFICLINLSCTKDKTGLGINEQAIIKIFHLSADPRISVIDVYIDGKKESSLDNLSFGSSSNLVELSAGKQINITITNQNSSSVSENVLSSFKIGPLQAGTNYAGIISGVIDPSNFLNPITTRDISLDFEVISNLRKNSLNPAKVGILFNHNSTDAPEIDLLLDGMPPSIADNLNYGENTGYISLDPLQYRIDIIDSDNNTITINSFQADLNNMAGKSLLLFIGGFLDPSQNQNGPNLRLLSGEISQIGGHLAGLKTDYSQITQINYDKHIQPIFNNFCTSCHSGNTGDEGLNLESWDNLIKGSQFGEVIIPYDAENSLMIELMTKLISGPHPLELGGENLSTEQIEFLARWVNEGCENGNGDVPYENSTNRLYVCNQDAGMVSVIDTDAKVVIRNIKFPDLGYSTSTKPHDVAIEPNGQYWYVTLIGDGKVLKFDRDNNLIADADFESAGLLAIHPTKDLLYVGHTLSIPTVPNNIGAITRSTMNLVSVPLIYDRPHAFIADHIGRYVYTASLTQNRYGIIDTDINPTELAAVIPFNGLHTLVQMNISPNDQEIYISSQLKQQLLVLDSSNPTNLNVVDSIIVGQHPWHPKFTPDGTRVYVGNNVSHTVSVVNTITRTEVTTIGVGDGSDGLAEPHGLVFTTDGQSVYVTNRNRNIPAEYLPRYDLGDNANAGTVVIINTSTNSIEKVLELEELPSGVAIYEE